jgi:hypothetical protein
VVEVDEVEDNQEAEERNLEPALIWLSSIAALDLKH